MVICRRAIGLFAGSVRPAGRRGHSGGRSPWRATGLHLLNGIKPKIIVIESVVGGMPDTVAL